MTDKAHINRGTFYIHYKDVSDLLQRLEDEMAEKLFQMCLRHTNGAEVSSYPFLTDLYTFFLENADLCRVLLGHNGDIAYRQRICAILHENYLYEFLSRLYPDHTKQLEYFCDFTISGNLNLVLAWLRDGAKEPPEEMAQLASKIMMQGIGVLEEQKLAKEGSPYGRPSFVYSPFSCSDMDSPAFPDGAAWSFLPP